MGKKEKFVYVHGVGPKELDVLLDTESVSTGQPILRFAQLSFVWSFMHSTLGFTSGGRVGLRLPRDTGYTNDSKNCGLSGGDLAKASGTWS